MPNQNSPYEAEAGGPKVLWFIATADEPVTVDELHDEFEVGRQSIAAVVRRLFRSGFLIRRQREMDGNGKPPYEYRVAGRANTAGAEVPA